MVTGWEFDKKVGTQGVGICFFYACGHDDDDDNEWLG